MIIHSILIRRAIFLFTSEILLLFLVVPFHSRSYSQGAGFVTDQALYSSNTGKITYKNPRVFNVHYSFELNPDTLKIDRSKDLKLWIPIPEEWDSQKAINITSINPQPHFEYEDTEHGNRMLFWDFGTEPEKNSYKVEIQFRLESYNVHIDSVDSRTVGLYNITSKEYLLYTRSTHTISITPKIKELAAQAVGDETNPYLQALKILQFAKKKMNYNTLDYIRGRGIKCLLDYPDINQNTGETVYEGTCSQYCAFFVALCRAVGIPARTVSTRTGYKPWLKEEDLKPKYRFETNLSPEGLAACQHLGHMGSHMIAEFYIPNYGWIPVNVQPGMIGGLHNGVFILTKGRDIMIGPQTPEDNNTDYGSQWVLLHKGRADMLVAVWNIAKIRDAKVKILLTADPFPADGLSEYPYEDDERYLRHWRMEALNLPSTVGHDTLLNILNPEQFCNENPGFELRRDAFICHMLRKQVGDSSFFKIVDKYIKLRQTTKQPIPTNLFQELIQETHGESMDCFFDHWFKNKDIPQLRLEKVTLEKINKNWHIMGSLHQLNETPFHLPLELAIDTKNGRETKKLDVYQKIVRFNLSTQNIPQKLLVDPDYNILKIQRMPPRLRKFWNYYPEYILIYGTTSESEANKMAAERFNEDYLGLGTTILKADTSVNKEDLNKKCVILFGRPETNKISQRFNSIFPIQFKEDMFTWGKMTYNKLTQGVAQIVENPEHPNNLFIMYAGLCGNAILKICDLYLYDSDASFVIFDGDKELVTGDWEEYDKNLVWYFDTENSITKH